MLASYAIRIWGLSHSSQHPPVLCRYSGVRFSMDDHKNVPQNAHTDPTFNTVLQSTHSVFISYQLFSSSPSSRPIFFSHLTFRPYLLQSIPVQLLSSSSSFYQPFLCLLCLLSSLPLLSFLHFTPSSITPPLNLLFPFLCHSFPSFTAPIHFRLFPIESIRLYVIFCLILSHLPPLPRCQICSNYFVFFLVCLSILFTILLVLYMTHHG